MYDREWTCGDLAGELWARACPREVLYAKIVALEHECQEHQGVAAACEQRAERAEKRVDMLAKSAIDFSNKIADLEHDLAKARVRIAALETQRTEDHESMIRQAEETADDMERTKKAQTYAAVLKAQIENLKGILNNEECDSKFERLRAEKAEAMVAEIHNTPKSEWEKQLLAEGRQTGLEEAAQKVTTIGFTSTAALIRGLAAKGAAK